MSLQEDVENALLRHEGALGNLLSHCKKLEIGDVESVREALQSRSALTLDELNKAQLEALRWANGIAVCGQDADAES